MQLKKGNTYELSVPVKSAGQKIDITDVQKVVFQFNDIKKTYPSEDVEYDSEAEVFKVYLTQQDTLALKGVVLWEVGVKYNDNTVQRTPIYKEVSLETIIKEVI